MSELFRVAFAKRRCLVPAAYYEWRDDSDRKTPFAVARVDGDPVAFGGMWEEWRSLEGETLRTFATITTDANRQLLAIQESHARQHRAGKLAHLAGRSRRSPATLLRPAREDALRRVWQVDKKVGNVRNDGPELLEPRTPSTVSLL